MGVQSDTEIARHALLYFHNRAIRYPENYTLDFDGLIAAINKKNSAFLDGFGLAISSSGIDDVRVKRTMEGLADQGRGRLPVRWMDFFTALQNEAAQINWVDAIQSVAVESVIDLGNGAAKTIKFLDESKWILLALAGGLVFIYASKEFRASAGLVGLRGKK